MWREWADQPHRMLGGWVKPIDVDAVPDPPAREKSWLCGSISTVNTRTNPLPLYLGPQLPRWQPRTAADVEEAIRNGSISERHWLDVKRPLGDSSEANNKKIACDLASFANDGGAIIYGVAEDKSAGTLSAEPFDLSGAAERIDQIARSRCDPPLYVACHPLAVDPANPMHGLLLVEVPPSPVAPHMADGRYHGRGDTTNRRLTDAEVERLHAIRSTRRLSAEQLIEREIARDPIPEGVRENSHLYVIARPLAAPPDLLTDTIEKRTLGDMVRSLSQRLGSVAYPDWGSLTSQEPRANGWGFHSHLLPGRRANLEDGHAERSMVDLEIGDDGSLSLVCGRASDQGRKAEDGEYVLDPVVALFTRGVVELAGNLGRDHGYGGRWLIAVAVTDLAKSSVKYSSAAYGTFRIGLAYVPFSADRYMESTEAVTSELLSRPGSVTRRLVRRLMRGLGTDGQNYRPLLHDPADPA